MTFLGEVRLFIGGLFFVLSVSRSFSRKLWSWIYKKKYSIDCSWTALQLWFWAGVDRMKRSDANSRRVSAIFWSRDPLPAEFASERLVISSRTQKTFDRKFQDLSNGVDHHQLHMQIREILINQSSVYFVFTLTILRPKANWRQVSGSELWHWIRVDVISRHGL
jgi:hypothetical protein